MKLNEAVIIAPVGKM